MRRLFRGAVPLLAALALARPTAADPPAPANLPDTLFATDDATSLPRVVAPRRPMLSPLREPAAPTTTAGADLPAPRERGHTSAPVVVAPSGLPTPAVAGPAGRPGQQPAPKAAPAAHAWPAAFRTGKAPEPPASKPTVDVQPAAAPANDAAAVEEAADVADLRRRVETLYGSEAANVAVETQPDGGVLVHVRIRGAAGADAAKAVKAVDVPQPGGAPVRVLLEVDR